MEKQKYILQETESLGINQDSYRKICESLGRQPNWLELQIYAIMWTENVSYKSSIRWVDALPNKGDKIIAGALEASAGVVEINEEECCVFKMGTHNHPSGINPYQGAATCVGDVCRDVVSLGARPMVVLNSLRFGDTSLDRTYWLMQEVMQGVSDYANMLYLENIGSEIFYHPSYNSNPLVNVMVAGITKKKHLLYQKKLSEGDLIYIAGNITKAEGSITSDQTDRIVESDPHVGGLLINAVVALNEAESILKVENLDIAGIVNACVDISGSTGLGIDIHVNQIPSEAEMSVKDILLSRTQERIIFVAKPEKQQEVERILNEISLDFAKIGKISSRKTLCFYKNTELEVELNAQDLALKNRDSQIDLTSKESETTNSNFIQGIPEPEDYWQVIKKLVKDPNLLVKEYLQINMKEDRDHSPSDSHITNLGDRAEKICFALSGNSVYTTSNPFVGSQINVAKAVRRIVCSGGKALALNDCLNYGSPFEDKVYSQFVDSVKGIAKASQFFNVPVVGGNVSFFNESSEEGKRQAIEPTPVIAMLGVLPSMGNHMSYIYRNKGDMIFMIGKSRNDICSSEYLSVYHDQHQSNVPYFNLDEEKQLNEVVAKLIEKKLICSAHSVERGGLFFNLLESAMPLGFGFDITSPAEIRKDAFLFGEAQGRVVVSVSMEKEDDFVDLMMESRVPFSTIGHITKGELRIDDISYGFINDYKINYQENSVE